jgi:hypothetical protein
MYSIWANLSLLLGLLIIFVLVWFVLTILAKAIFEDLIGSFYHKMRKKIIAKRREKDDDHYVY